MEDVPHAETPLKVLVVDDQADSADAVAFMLSLMGHDVHTAYGPREASIDHHLVKPASPLVLHRLLSGIHPT